MPSLIEQINQNYKKTKVTTVKSGDIVRVHQRITESGKARVQVFEGMVIATRRANSHTGSITVRRIASGVGVEKTFLIHSPLIEKIEVTKRSSVRRDKLNYMKVRSGKSARLASVAFNQDEVNVVDDVVEETPPKDEADDTVATEDAVEQTSEDQAETEETTDETTPKAETTKDATDKESPKTKE